MSRKEIRSSSWKIVLQNPKGFTTVSGGGGGPVAQAAMATYNSAHGLYSEANLREAVEASSHNLAHGVKG